MTDSFQTVVVTTAREAVPFLVITALWVLVMFVLYGLFLVTKPTNVEYDAWVHGTVFLIPSVGFLGHVLSHSLEAAHTE